MKRRIWFEERKVERYTCPWRDAGCLGDRCIAWIPDEDLGHLGICALVPSVEA